MFYIFIIYVNQHKLRPMTENPAVQFVYISTNPWFQYCPTYTNLHFRPHVTKKYYILLLICYDVVNVHVTKTKRNVTKSLTLCFKYHNKVINILRKSSKLHLLFLFTKKYIISDQRPTNKKNMFSLLCSLGKYLK